MTSYSRGDVVLVKYPNSDLKTFKRRPALVVQDLEAVSDLDMSILACISSIKTHGVVAEGPTRIKVEKQTRIGRSMGLLYDSFVVMDDLASVTLKAIDRKVGRCTIMSRVDGCLKVALGLD